FRTYNANLVGVPMDDEGIELELLEKAIKENPNTKFIYLIPNFQNPTGKTMSLARRKSVYELCNKYDVCILEDNPYGDLRFDGEDIPNIKSFDTEGIVFYVGSFSKILSPGLRVGFVCADEAVIKKLTVAKQCSDVHTNILAQKICSDYIMNYDLNQHIKSIRKIYKEKYELMLKCIKTDFSSKVKVFETCGGLFVWCVLPNNYDVVDFANEALEKYKVAIVPGNAFLADESQKSSCFRLNFSKPTDQEIVDGIGYLGKLTKDLFD
ncbi:MAG: PLP-dependent aminotransferase family protein, partial [Oscillospiraceae bacterium]